MDPCPPRPPQERGCLVSLRVAGSRCLLVEGALPDQDGAPLLVVLHGHTALLADTDPRDGLAASEDFLEKGHEFSNWAKWLALSDRDYDSGAKKVSLLGGHLTRVASMEGAAAWKVSLHGGHSGSFCEHAEGDLRASLEAAIRAGYSTFGVSEHAPRSASRFLYGSEVAKGYTVDRLGGEFDDYAVEVALLAEELSDRLVVLRGFEAEVVPTARYREEMLGLRERHDFDYMVGSVHYVDELSIDGSMDEFRRARDVAGGLEALAVRYYQTVSQMVSDLEPEVVGHLDLLRKHAREDPALESPRVQKAAGEALEIIREKGCILDCNTRALRKRLGYPYPAPWLVRMATGMDIPFCFGDDSHRPSEVGSGIDEARIYLLENGVESITTLAREAGAIVKRRVALEAL